ncbi:PAS domain-containing protein [Streptomyces sp. SBT349]|uniref:PAS domain-containing protein n=1 Tax=Streptomyces sp. SBT349 TaxID=1580539 RepID=UPI00066D16E5|nr:PAS domain-containing protein [Streptomyces sp. SBT349]
MTIPSEAQPAHRDRVTDDRLLSALLDGADAALFAVDTQGRVTHWNRHAERLLGWSNEQAVGREGLGGWAVREADAADLRARLLAVLSAPPGPMGAPARQAHEFPMLRRDGGRLLVRARTTAIKGADGRPSGVYCAFGDVHAHLALERNLALSEALLGDSTWAVLVADADLRTVAANERAAQAMGLTPVDMLGEPLAEFVGDGLPELESALERTLAGQAPDEPVELWLTPLDDGMHEEDRLGGPHPPPGGQRHCLLSGFLRLDTPGSLGAAPLGVAWIFQDVTRTRRAAQDTARRAFRDSQLSRATRAAAECEDPVEAAQLHLHYALAGFAEHALLDVLGDSVGLTRLTESPGPFHEAAGAAHGAAVRYGQGHPALQALERGVTVRATGGVARSGWAFEHRWPEEAEHALCVVLRSRGRSLGVVTFLRGAGRRSFDRADAAYGEDVALRVAAALDLGDVAGTC